MKKKKKTVLACTFNISTCTSKGKSKYFILLPIPPNRSTYTNLVYIFSKYLINKLIIKIVNAYKI